MNELPERGGWTGSPQERMPAIAPQGGREVWQPGYPIEGAGFHEEDEGSFVHDLHRYFWILFRHRWIVLGTAFVFMCIGLLVTFLSTPIYEASATLQIDREPAKILNVQEMQTDLGTDAAFYATQYEILKSRSLAEDIVSNFSVEELQKFTGNGALTPWTKLWEKLRSAFSSTPATEEDVDVAALQKDAADKLLKNLSVQPVGNSRVVRLTFESPSPSWAEKSPMPWQTPSSRSRCSAATTPPPMRGTSCKTG